MKLPAFPHPQPVTGLPIWAELQQVSPCTDRCMPGVDAVIDAFVVKAIPVSIAKLAQLLPHHSPRLRFAAIQQRPYHRCTE
jgi:hypothetical protein